MPRLSGPCWSSTWPGAYCCSSAHLYPAPLLPVMTLLAWIFKSSGTMPAAACTAETAIGKSGAGFTSPAVAATVCSRHVQYVPP